MSLFGQRDDQHPQRTQLVVQRTQPDQQFEELIETVMACERGARVQPDWSWAAPGGRLSTFGHHVCPLPETLPTGAAIFFGQLWECPCGQTWRREMGGGWLTVDEPERKAPGAPTGDA
jgi:hypothetical protein